MCQAVQRGPLNFVRKPSLQAGSTIYIGRHAQPPLLCGSRLHPPDADWAGLSSGLCHNAVIQASAAQASAPSASAAANACQTSHSIQLVHCNLVA